MRFCVRRSSGNTKKFCRFGAWRSSGIVCRWFKNCSKVWLRRVMVFVVKFRRRRLRGKEMVVMGFRKCRCRFRCNRLKFE